MSQGFAAEEEGARRVISLLPSATEIVCAIGGYNQLVGITHECDYPEEIAHLPQVTSSAIDHHGQSCAAIDRHIKQALHEGSSIYRLDEQRVKHLDPDLIITQELCEVCAVAYGDVCETVRRIDSPIPIVSLEPHSLSTILETIEQVGDIMGLTTQAASVVEGLRRRIATVDQRASLRTWHPLCVCIEWTDPLMVGGHWVPEMVRRAGGVDPLGVEGQPSMWIQPDQLVEAQPDVLVLMPCGFDLPSTLIHARPMTAAPWWKALTCVNEGRVVVVDGSAFFNRPGPRIVQGLEILEAALWTQPGEPLPPGAAWMDLS